MNELLCLNMKLVFFILIITAVSGSGLSPDSLKFYHDMTSGRGLYSDFHKIISLNVTTFKTELFNSSTPKSWLIEFYNSWCGHCHRFSPTWKRLTIDLYDWKDVIGIGAVDCSNSINTPLCREYEVMYYPTVKYFPPSPPESFVGTIVSQRTVDTLRQAVVEFLRNRSELALTPYNSNLSDFWKTTNVDSALVTVEDNSSYIGAELALDFHSVKNLKVISVLPSNEVTVDGLDVTVVPAIYFLSRPGESELIPVTEFKRHQILKSVGEVLTSKGFSVPKPPDFSEIIDEVVDVSKAVALLQLQEQIKNKLHSNELTDIVFQVDIEGALSHTLFVEVSSHKNIDGEMFIALQNYIEVLIKYFPIGKNGISFLKCVKEKIHDKNEINGHVFYNLTKICEEINAPVFLETKERWIGCKGSRVHFRGFPCSLWTTFHTLTVQADLKKADDPRQVLNAMTGYIKHFFGCTDCSNHFQQMAVTMAGNVSSTEESVLWLWKAHNSVNRRLKGDPTEDPMHPKLQFPPSKICRNCSESEVWDEGKVLEFLRRMYTNISFIVMEDVTPSTSLPPIASKSLRHEIMVDESSITYSKLDNRSHRVFLWDFNFFDVSLCVILYLISMAIIILVCIKFYRKTYRKKTYLYDGFQKV